MSNLQFFGYLSGILTIVAYFRYIYDILKRKTKPERASWAIWATLGFIAFFSQLAKGATNSLWMPGVQAPCLLIIFILSIKYGYGKLSTRDIISLIIASIGLIIWFFTKEAAYALIITIIVDFIGSILTTIKSYEDPGSEAITGWLLFVVGDLFSALSVGEFNFILLIYPLYMFFANLSVVVVVLLGKRRIKHPIA